MLFNALLLASGIGFSILTGTLAAPGLPDHPIIDKKWFSINPNAQGGPKPWPNHQLRYKFLNDDSKNRLGSTVTAAWKLWTDAGVDTANINIIESGDDDALVISATKDAKAQTSELSSLQTMGNLGSDADLVP